MEKVKMIPNEPPARSETELDLEDSFRGESPIFSTNMYQLVELGSRVICSATFELQALWHFAYRYFH